MTRDCPLHCPGCYAYEPDHLGGKTPLRGLADFHGQALVDGEFSLILVRYRELGILLPKVDAMGIEVQLVTSAVRPIPRIGLGLANLHLVASIDGLAPEHDRRRSPATYDRVVKHIFGHRIDS